MRQSTRSPQSGNSKPAEKTTARLSGDKPAKPAKPYPEYPLTPHPSGRWCKKIRGKLHYFGPWADPDGALKKYLEQKDDLHAGRKPRVRGDGFTIKQLANHFLNSKQRMVDTGELAGRTWRDYHQTCAKIIEAFRPNRLVSDLHPDEFETFRAKLAKRCGPVTLGNDIQRVRVVFKYAFDSGHIAAPVRYGQGFKRPSKKVLRLERARKGPRMFSPGQIHQLLAAANPAVRAMILLGVNCGFGNADCANLPLKALDLEAGWANHPRPKTGIDRRCPLWPETVAAIRAALAKRPEPKEEGAAELVFITKYGKSWRPKATCDSPLSNEIGKLLRELKIRQYNDGRDGLGFYALRHTFETIGGESRDQVAVDFIMGHARDDMASLYRERISDERLRAVTDRVRGWLFPGPPSGGEPARESACQQS